MSNVEYIFCQCYLSICYLKYADSVWPKKSSVLIALLKHACISLCLMDEVNNGTIFKVLLSNYLSQKRKMQSFSEPFFRLQFVFLLFHFPVIQFDYYFFFLPELFHSQCFLGTFLCFFFFYNFLDTV